MDRIVIQTQLSDVMSLVEGATFGISRAMQDAKLADAVVFDSEDEVHYGLLKSWAMDGLSQLCAALQRLKADTELLSSGGISISFDADTGTTFSRSDMLRTLRGYLVDYCLYRWCVMLNLANAQSYAATSETQLNSFVRMAYHRQP